MSLSVEDLSTSAPTHEIGFPVVLRLCATSSSAIAWRGQVYAALDVDGRSIPYRVPLAITLADFWTVEEAVEAAAKLLRECFPSA